MRKRLWFGLMLVLASVFSVTASAEEQAVQPQVTATPVAENTLSLSDSVDRYMNLLQGLKIEASLDFVYPRLFELFPRDRMLSIMRQMLAENETMQMSIGDVQVKQIGEPRSFSGGSYAVVDYSQELLMKLKGQAAENPEAIKQIRQMFESQYGADAVTFDDASKTFSIHSEKSFLAINDKISKGWKFISRDNDSPEIQRILPPEVAAALKQSPGGE